ncbi:MULTISPECIES: hypothetical protein [Burkholderia]|uniref:hypothetical protein n=1 Tax=Burkholderia TaxID=32008 RepID=UPI0013F17E2B|nr:MULTISPECIES: hypothetical protein [Burkholderia]MBR8093117.1 hypothetical protein [Burkholderia cenocepacia]MBS6359081.1 hypothetical protein [Burkholderia sp.]MBY4714274.1 hypothetical protein [Burkholderia cepacia]MBY4740087.1 hypothetical protein [Burkholderia cepacia]MBY4743401.1 hypothetical protein [Burkholderia cepacia]
MGAVLRRRLALKQGRRYVREIRIVTHARAFVEGIRFACGCFAESGKKLEHGRLNI